MRSAVYLTITFAAIFSAACTRQQTIEAKQDAGPIPVRIARVVARDVQRTVDSVGTLYPYDESVISAEIDGRVEEIKVDLGDKVAAGQVLVRIQDEEQRYLVAQTEAQLRQALARLGLKDENDKVKDVSETPEPRRARAELFDAEQRYKRVKNLVEQGIASQADLDQAQARFKSLEAAYDSTLFQTRNLIQEVERNRAQLDFQRKKLRDATVKAPFAGAVKEKTVNIGQYVRANTALITLVKTDPLRLRLEIPERMAPWIKTGQALQVDVEAFQDRSFPAKIWRISPSVDQSKRTFVAEALVENGAGLLKPGSYGRARVPTNKVERITLVPSRAINYVFGSNKAYIVTNGVVEARDVKLGDRYDQDVEITEGVKDGEQVAVSQLGRLDTGSKVRASEEIQSPAHRGS